MHLLPAQVIAAGDIVTAPSDSAEGSKPESSPAMSSNLTRCHRAVISSRDRAYAAFKTHFTSRIGDVVRTCNAELSQEQQWKIIWDKMVMQSTVSGVE